MRRAADGTAYIADHKQGLLRLDVRTGAVTVALDRSVRVLEVVGFAERRGSAADGPRGGVGAAAGQRRRCDTSLQ